MQVSVECVPSGRVDKIINKATKAAKAYNREKKKKRRANQGNSKIKEKA